MAPTVLAALLSLPEGQRAELAIALWESLSDAQRDQSLPVDSLLAAELERRAAEHAADPASAIPWAEVRRKLNG